MSENNKDLSYQRNVLFQNDSFEIVSIIWDHNSLSSMHDHGWSQCMVLVEEGSFENILDLGIKKERQIIEKGGVIVTPVGAKHETRCLTVTGKTLNVYTPKIQNLSGKDKFSIPSVSDLKNQLQLFEGTDIEQLKNIINTVREHSLSTHSPFFMNQLFSGILPQMLMAEELIAQTKTTLATQEASPAFSMIESEVVESLGRLIGWPENNLDGVCVPGGSAANFMAIHTARQKKYPLIKKQGMSGQQLKVFVSSEAHYSLKKACVALGIGTDGIVLVPVDNKGRMIPDELEQLIIQHKNEGNSPLLVCATFGTTVLGAFDSVSDLSFVCKKHDLWLHVDGAWGGPALFSDQLKHLTKGIELADSMTFDAHKLFGASLTCSFYLTQHKGILQDANDVSGGDYLFHSQSEEIDRGKLSWQCGRKADAASFWTIWKNAGTVGLSDFVNRQLDISKKTLEWIKDQPRLKLVSEPDFLNICIRVQSPYLLNNKDWSRIVRESMKDDNLAMVNYSQDNEGSFLRLILANPYLEFHHIQQILKWALDVK